MDTAAGVTRRVRLFVQRGTESDYRYLAWFLLKGDDFYWGPAHPSPDVASVPFSGTKLTIEVPSDLEDLPRVHWKASRHASGVMHITRTGSRSSDRNDVHVDPPTTLSGLTRFAALIEKPADQLPRYSRALDRDGANAVVVRLNAEAWERRTYWEFFLAPAGSWAVPPWLIGQQVADQPITVSLGPEPDVVLAMRQASLQGHLNQWHPEIGIWLNLHAPSASERATIP